jgi:xanthine dehydrogenase accessory factor
MAGIAGFDIEIIDPRTAFATDERFPGVRLFADWPEPVLQARPLDPYTAVAAVTHDPKIDDFALKAALEAGCFYVGALGSRKTHASRLQRLIEAGVSEDRIASIHAPIGLPIGAASPQEIAVAVLAEIVQVFRSRGLTGIEASRAA